ncbi:MAG: UbiA family prenyltransferase [Bacteroidia bacterium]
MKLLSFLIKTHLHLSLAHALLIHCVMVVLLGQYNWALTLFLFGITGFVYSLNSLKDQSEDQINVPQRQNLFNKFGRLILSFYTITALFALLFLVADIQFLIAVAAIFVIGIIYSFPLFPWIQNGKLRLFRLKEIIIAKNFVTSISVAYYVFLLPFTYFRQVPDVSVWMIVLTFMIITTVSTIICDIRDISGDREAGIRTIATELGRKKSLNLCYGLISIPIFISLVFTSLDMISVNGFWIIFVISATQLSVLIYDHFFRFRREFQGFASEIFAYVTALSLFLYV